LNCAIEIRELTKKYKSLVAVNKLNLTVKTDTIHGFLGPNGAGKTTTIKMLIGLLKPDSGSAKIFGQEVGWNQPDIRAKIGYMPELPKFPKHLMGDELLDIYGRMYCIPPEERKQQIMKLLEIVGLHERGSDLIGTYSKGMQQRLGIAQALLNKPELVILDEPSLGLDPVGMVEVRETIKEIAKEGVTVFLSSHLLHEVEQICTNVTIINKGIALVSDTLTQISAKIQGSSTIEAEVDNLSKTVIEKVKELSFVEDTTKIGEETLLITSNTRENVRSQVSRAITAGGGIVLSVNVKGESLEDVFIELLKPHAGETEK